MENNKESSQVQISEEIKESSTQNYFSENEINILIKQFNISSELKLNKLINILYNDEEKEIFLMN